MSTELARMDEYVKPIASKVRTRHHVEEIWLAEFRLNKLARQWNQAEIGGDTQLADGIWRKCEEIRQLILAKYDIILEPGLSFERYGRR